MFLVVLALVTGCLPYVIPPLAADVGATHSTENGTHMGVHVDAGLSPMQLMPSQFGRRWDATLSGSFDRIGTRDSWGGALAAGPIFFPMPVENPNAVVRLLPQVVGRLTNRDSSVGARVVLEWASFVNGTSSDNNGGFYAYGEGAIGGYVETAYRNDDEFVITAGVTVRIPAMAGIACCFH
jgi:hypothetical protein